MSSHPAKRNSTPAVLSWLAALALAVSAPTQAASSVAVGSGSSAGASLNFRIVIPGHLKLSLSEPVEGRSTLDVELYSSRGALMVNRSDESSESRLAEQVEGGVLKTTRMQANGGVYTIASP